MLAFHSARMKAALLVMTISTGTLALALAAADFSVSASQRAEEVAALEDEVRDLLGRIGEVEQSLATVAQGRDYLIDRSRDGLAAIIDHTGIAPDQHGAIYTALIPDAAPPSIPAVTAGAPVGERVQAVKVTAALLSQRLGDDRAALDKRAAILAAVPSILPAKGYISSEFGMRVSPFHQRDRMHNGIDVAADVGTTIVAPAAGTIRYASTYGGYGNFVRIDHGHGIETRFAHAAEMFVKKGERVERGTPIATIGMTGRTTGPHLHYEIYVHGKPVDPSRFLFATDADTMAVARTPRDMLVSTAIGGDSETPVPAAEAASMRGPELLSGVSFDLADREHSWLTNVLPAKLSFLKATDLAMTAALLLLFAIAGAVMPARAEAKVGVSARSASKRKSQHYGFSGGWTIWGHEEGDDD